MGDAGIVRTATGLVEVTDTKPGPGGTIVHEGVVREGELRVGDEAEAQVDGERREATARSHTATHVLHHTIRSTRWASTPGRRARWWRRDGCASTSPTSRPCPATCWRRSSIVANRRLADDDPVRAYETTREFAQQQGAMALFGEKYGDIVRVVEVGDYSIELCGGTHVPHTGQVALLRLAGESSIGSGLRRIEALTGPDALRYVNAERRLLEEIMEAVGATDPARPPNGSARPSAG